MWLEELLPAQHVVEQWSHNQSGSQFQVQSCPRPTKQRAAWNKGVAYMKEFTAFLKVIYQACSESTSAATCATLFLGSPMLPLPGAREEMRDPGNEVATYGLWFWFGSQSAYTALVQKLLLHHFCFTSQILCKICFLTFTVTLILLCFRDTDGPFLVPPEACQKL